MDAIGTAGEATCVSGAAEATTGATTKTSVSSASAGAVSATAGVTSAVLRPQGQRQKKSERRNGCQTPHTALL
jgi:hypothetical protein